MNSILSCIIKNFIDWAKAVVAFLAAIFIITLFIKPANAGELDDAYKLADKATAYNWQVANNASSQTADSFKFCAAYSHHLTIGFILGSNTAGYKALTERNAKAIVYDLLAAKLITEKQQSGLEAAIKDVSKEATQMSKAFPDMSASYYADYTFQRCVATSFQVPEVI